MSSSQRNSSSLNSYQFDFDLGLASRPSSRPLNPSSAPKPAAPYAPKPSWTHQPAPTSSSMVGDIFGKSWSPSPTPSSSSRLGIPDKNPNLFSDLLGPALKSSKPSFSTNNLADSHPLKSTPRSSSADNLNTYRTPQPAKLGPTSKKDPFDSLAAFASKPAVATGSKPGFGSKPAGSDYSFQKPKPPPATQPFMPDPLDTLFATSAAPPATQPFMPDPLDTLFATSAAPVVKDAAVKMPEVNDWDFGTEFGGDGGTTTELEGLGAPPAGVTAGSAKTKGLDHYKQGQYADAIKWLTWSLVLYGDGGAAGEVLVSRASCYKEVGEYKKAVADCSKVLERDGGNVAVLLQRALLYESTEKYRLGADDLRMVLKIDPGNRLARSTIHRLNKLAD